MTLRTAVLATTILSFLLGAPTAHPQSSADLRILFTGYLLGYYRVPDVQPEDYLQDCRPESGSDAWVKASPAAADLKSKIPLVVRPANTILVGMGDNFAVELGSRTYGPDAAPLHPKMRNPGYTPNGGKPGDPWPPMTEPWQIGDNVGCFLSLAGYDAVVPGKEDFYFGPERLRRIAQRLAGAKDNGTFHPVHMLAANLVVKTKLWEKPTEIPDSQKALKFTPGMPDDVEVPTLSDGDTVLPILQYIELKQKPPSHLQPYLCRAVDSGRPDSISFDGDICNNRWVLDPGSQADTYLLPALDQNTNYGLCVDKERDEAKNKAKEGTNAKGKKQVELQHYCLRFTVAEPFLLATGGWAKPYRYLKDQNVVIYGVVDPELTSLVGRDNLSWKNESYQAEAQALDPVPSLRQSMQLFEQKEKPPAGLRQILLAQMSKAKAEELAAHFGFDVVITAADDHAHATPEQQVTLHPDKDEESVLRKNPFRAFVVVPWKGYKSDYVKETSSLMNPLEELSMEGNSNERCLHVSGEWKESGASTGAELEKKKDVKERLTRVVAGFVNWKGPAGNKPFEQAVLQVLRQRTHADVAMMQKRDFYFGPFRQTHNDGERLERVLWRGDIVQVLTVKGTTLKKVMTESAQFDQADSEDRHREERARGLTKLGIQKTDEGDYMVDGMALDPERLYTVVTTNHIAAGDTGYPELNDPELADNRLPMPVAEDREIEGKRIAWVVCSFLSDNGYLDHYNSGCIADAPLPSGAPKNTNVLFATLQRTPTDRGPTHSDRRRAWWGSISHPAILPQGLPQPEQDAQQRPSWRFSVKEASFSFSRAHNNLSEADRVTKLGGITEPGVAVASSRSVGFTLRSEWVRSGLHVDEYTRLSLEYASQTTSQTTTVGDPTDPNNLPHPVALPDLLSLSSNRAITETGLFVHSVFGFPAPHKSYPKWGFVLGTRTEMPLVHERFLVGPHFATDGTKDQQEFSFQLPRTTRFLGRFGLRLEGADSYLEAGYQGGYQRHVLDLVTTNKLPCDLSASVSLSTCLNNQIPGLDPGGIDKHLKNPWPNGFYADFSWKLPLPFRKIAFITRDQVEEFQPQSGDNNSQTRYRIELDNKFSIPLFRNVTLEPGIGTFLYKNKVALTQLTRITPKLTLKYSFDFYSGGKWKKALWYKPAGGGGSDE